MAGSSITGAVAAAPSNPSSDADSPRASQALGLDAAPWKMAGKSAPKMKVVMRVKIINQGGSKEGYFFFRGRFWIFWVPGSMLSCFSAVLLLCFSASLLVCFSAFLPFLLLCLSTSMLFCFLLFLLFAVPASVPLCFTCFFSFLLLCFPCFSVFLFFCFCAFLLPLFYFFFSLVMCFCCSTSCSSASLLPVFTASLFFLFFCFILSRLYPK